MSAIDAFLKVYVVCVCVLFLVDIILEPDEDEAVRRWKEGEIR